MNDFDPRAGGVTPPLKKKTFLDLNKEDQAEIKTGKAFEEMQNLEAWKFYGKILLALIDDRRRSLEVASPVTGEDGQGYALRMERAKGTIIGLRLALEQPSLMIQAAKDLRKRLLGSESEDTE